MWLYGAEICLNGFCENTIWLLDRNSSSSFFILSPGWVLRNCDNISVHLSVILGPKLLRSVSTDQNSIHYIDQKKPL